MKNKNTCILALVFFYETGHKNSTKAFIVLNYVSIYGVVFASPLLVHLLFSSFPV